MLILLKKPTSISEGVEKLEPMCMAGRNVK